MKIAKANNGSYLSKKYLTDMDDFFNVNFFQLDDKNLGQTMQDPSYDLMIFDFPEGSVLIKTFGYLNNHENSNLDKQLLETRLLIKKAAAIYLILFIGQLVNVQI